MKKKVLLLGATGQLGSLITSSVPAGIELHSFSSSELDITNSDQLSKLIKELNPEVIINSAAYTLVDKAEKETEKSYAVNAQGPENIARCSGRETLILHISTDFVFDGCKCSPYFPGDNTHPLSVYGKSKLAGEQALLNLAADRTIIVRTAWLYSALGKNFMNTMLFLMDNKEELSVVSDQKGTPTSAHILADVVWQFATILPEPGVYHWTDQEDSLEEVSWYDFACEIQQQALKLGLLENKIPIYPITTEAYPTPATRPSYSILDKTKTYDALGFKGEHWTVQLEKVLSKIKQ